MVDSAVLIGAVGGGVGGALGAAVGWFVGKRLGKPGTRTANLAPILGVVAAIGGSMAARAVLAPSAENRIDASSPTLAILHRYYPDKYQRIVAVAKANPSDKIALHNAVAPIIGETVREHARQIDDASATRLFGLLVAEAKVMRDKAPAACISMLAGGSARVDLSTIMTPQMKRMDADTTAAVLEQIATRPVAPAQPLAPAQARALALSALDRLAPADKALVADMFAHARRPASDVESRTMCGFDIALFQDALNGPPGTVRALIAAR